MACLLVSMKHSLGFVYLICCFELLMIIENGFLMKYQNKEELLPLGQLAPGGKVIQGSVFRLYGVCRYDIMKTIDDRKDPVKIAADFYDFILVDAHIISPNVYLLINTTVDSGNEGKIFAIIEGVFSRGYITSDQLLSYFVEPDNFFLLTRVVEE